MNGAMREGKKVVLRESQKGRVTKEVSQKMFKRARDRTEGTRKEKGRNSERVQEDHSVVSISNETTARGGFNRRITRKIKHV